MAKTVEPVDELERLYKSTNSEFRKRLDDFILLIIKRFFELPGQEEIASATDALAESFGKFRMFADVLGRLRLVRELGLNQGSDPEDLDMQFGAVWGDLGQNGANWGKTQFAGHSIGAPSLPPIMGLPFEEALQNLMDRAPVLAISIDAIRRAYGMNQQFALIRSTEQVITEKVQGLLAETLAQGRSFESFRQAFEELNQAGFVDQYASTVFRTGLTTAYSGGRLAQADQNRDAIAGLEYQAVGDADTRQNHQAADGLIAEVDDPVWNLLSPPLGFNCRCTLRIISRVEAEREGLLDETGRLPRAVVPPAAFPDQRGFGQRPDRAIYGR